MIHFLFLLQRRHNRAVPRATATGTGAGCCLVGRATLLAMAAATIGLCWAWLTPPLPAAEVTTVASTNTFIFCTNGATMLPTNSIFRGSVRVFDPQLYLECEHLTVYYPSNTAATSTRDPATPSIGSVNVIVAETNLPMMMRGATIVGDRAVYTATNDIIEVTGEMVIIETDSGFAYGTNFFFNRRSMELKANGPTTLESKAGVNLIETTNNPSGSPGNRPRRGPNIPGNPSPAPRLQ